MTTTTNAMEEGDFRMRTVHCLRGRLLAERQASKLAQQQALFLADKLVELEERIREETKLRQKADKKLKLLIKKLQSLEISATLHLHSSDSSGLSSASASSKSQIEHQDSSSCSSAKIQDSNADSQSSSISEEVAVNLGKSSEELITVSEVLEALKNMLETRYRLQ
ncbi:uncharacterized protein [Euphorbia lathyris]|uniref:uncharacterized protein isoform X2 n=1 Tax=Euphorbia lathyris TaxID=212925 RepID=UPI0033140386